VNAAYVILAAPLLGALLLLAGHRRLLEPVAGWVVVVLGFVSFGASLWLWVSLLGRSATDRVASLPIFSWVPVDRLQVSFGLQVDPLSVFFCLFVTGVSSLIFLYSIGYMHRDPSFARFFFYLSLFLFSMVILVLADNFLFSFLGWEGVGYCSYGLVGFWFDRDRAAVAAKKAFVTNRIGDFGFMIALFLMYEHFGSFNFSRVLTPLAHGATLPTAFATGLGLMLLLGACGKSAQFPLYMWLPDAMEGPTPISALIHAATMVTAGVYLLARSAPILHFSPVTMWLVACIGITTAFIASTIACVETDIKRILAYSTLAEIGFMFLAEGSGDSCSASVERLPGWHSPRLPRSRPPTPQATQGREVPRRSPSRPAAGEGSATRRCRSPRCGSRMDRRRTDAELQGGRRPGATTRLRLRASRQDRRAHPLAVRGAPCALARSPRPPRGAPERSPK